MSCVKEIDEARALLTKAEKVASLDARMSLIDEARDIFESCLEGCPSLQEVNKIKNIKKSFVRYLVSQIEKMKLENPDMFSFYIKTVYLTFNDEIKELQEEDKAFASKKEWIDEQFSEEIQSLLRILEKK
jgi:hypothetical protein